jgi:leucyl/phenylalanyl-tRNA---protein transferase
MHGGASLTANEATKLRSLSGAAAADRQSDVYREPLRQTATRYALGAAYSLTKNGPRDLLPYWRRWLVECIHPRTQLPDPQHPFDDHGRAGLVYDLSARTLTEAYRRGLFVGGHFGTLAWMSPPQRCVQFVDEFRMSKRLRRLMRQGRYSVTFDRDFEGVIVACARRPLHLTWITPKVMRAYAELFDAGHVHSFEVWNERGELAGGGYGVAIGGAFATESQFSREPNTSKLGFTVLNRHLARWGFAFNDGKVMTPTCHDMGFRDVPRLEFLARLAQSTALPGKPGRWQVEADVAAVADWQA